MLAERNKRVPGLGARIGAILGEELLMQSEFLKTIHNQGRDLGRREELLRMASWIDDEAELERLRTVTDLADLEREVRQIVERRAQGASDA